MPLKETTSTLSISEEDLGQRVDRLLAQHFPEHSRSYFQFLIDEGYILLNGHPIKKRYQPVLGDKIEIDFQPVAELDVRPEPIALDILYEDEHLIAINKPADMVVHPAPGAPNGTFANALLYHCSALDPNQFEPLRPGIVHRLDKDTTGILIGAKTHTAHKGLIELFSSRKVEKSYLAICCGTPPEGEFSAPIKRHPTNRKQMAIDPSGKEAISRFKILHSKQGLSLVEIALITGRTHQIRTHLKHLNCPILGDMMYGNSSLNQKYKVSKQLLHAQQIKFSHPISNIPLEIYAPIPNTMKNFIDLIHQA